MYLRGLDQLAKGMCLAKIDESLKRMKTSEKVKLLPMTSGANYVVPLLPDERRRAKVDFVPFHEKASFAWWAGSLAAVVATPKLMQRVILGNASLKHFVADKGALSAQVLISGPRLVRFIQKELDQTWRERAQSK